MSPIALHVVRSYIFFLNHLGHEGFVGRLKVDHTADSRSISFSIGWFFLPLPKSRENKLPSERNP